MPRLKTQSSIQKHKKKIGKENYEQRSSYCENSYIKFEDLTFPLKNNRRWVIVTDVINNEVSHFVEYNRNITFKKKIFDDVYSDKNSVRFYKQYKDDDIMFVHSLKHFLRLLKEKRHQSYEFDIGGYSFIKSLVGGDIQRYHTDYIRLPKDSRYASQVKWPYSGLIAFDDGCKLLIEGNEVNIPKYSCIIMRGDVIHSGYVYNHINCRLHFYMDSPEYQNSIDQEQGWCKKNINFKKKKASQLMYINELYNNNS